MLPRDGRQPCLCSCQPVDDRSQHGFDIASARFDGEVTGRGDELVRAGIQSVGDVSPQATSASLRPRS